MPQNEPARIRLQQVVDLVAPGAMLVEHETLTGGVSALLVALTFRRPDGASARVVVRRHEAGSSEERAEAEFALLSHLAKTGVPVPQMLAFDGSGTRLDTPFLVMEFIEGTTRLPDPVPSARAMADGLARIHALDDVGGLGLPTRLDPAPELRIWLEGHAGADELLAAVESAAPPWAEAPRLLHGDFWPGNVIWRDGDIVAVLDWEDAALGDPLSDVACARVELLCAAGVDAMDAFTDQYRLRARLAPVRLAAWDLYVSAAALHYMDDWGLPQAVLESRRARTRAFRANAERSLAEGRLSRMPRGGGEPPQNIRACMPQNDAVPSDPAAVRDMYDATAQFYAQMMDAEIEQPLYADVLGRLCDRIRDVPGPVVDAACGSGHMLGWVQQRLEPDRELIGVDLSPQMVAITAGRLGPTGRAVVGDMTRLPMFEDGSVACLINFFALHHLDATQSGEALREWRRVLVPGGQLIVAAWEGEGTIDYGEHADLVAVRIRADALRRWAEEAGFTVERCRVEPVEDFPMDAIYLEATA